MTQYKCALGIEIVNCKSVELCSKIEESKIGKSGLGCIEREVDLKIDLTVQKVEPIMGWARINPIGLTKPSNGTDIAAYYISNNGLTLF